MTTQSSSKMTVLVTPTEASACREASLANRCRGCHIAIQLLGGPSDIDELARVVGSHHGTQVVFFVGVDGAYLADDTASIIYWKRASPCVIIKQCQCLHSVRSKGFWGRTDLCSA